MPSIFLPFAKITEKLRKLYSKQRKNEIKPSFRLTQHPIGTMVIDFSTLNQTQYETVTAPCSPILVLAGAGSGKTSVITFRISYLIEQGVSPSQILVVTFTNKAAKEIEERVLKLSRTHCCQEKPLICTFHSLGTYILRNSIHILGRSNHFVIYDQNDSEKLLKTVLEKLNINKTQADLFRYEISKKKNELISPEKISSATVGPCFKDVPFFKDVYTQYQNKLEEVDAVDFDDLLYLTVKLFQEHKEEMSKYQNLWKALLIDEYQDTNHAQYLIARYIVSQHQNIFAVGDPDQSIYSWRGANINNILNFEKDYPKTRIIRLEENYRSHGNILNAANALILKNRSRLDKQLRSVKTPGEKIRLFIGETDREEAEFVAREVERLHRKNISLKDICIFYRTNFQSRIFEDALLRKKIPYQILGGLSFYKRKEIQDILSFLRMLVTTKDIISFERSVNIPKRGLGNVCIGKIIEFTLTNKLSLIEVCERIGNDPGFKAVKVNAKQIVGLKDYASLITSLKNFKGPLHELVSETARSSCYLEYLKQDDKDSFEDRKSNIDELISKTYEWEQNNNESDLNRFLEDLALKSSSDESPLNEDRLNLMTIHTGKGLEFEVAFIVGLEETLFPHANSMGSHENLEEERRLCYVGITRAKDLLYLSRSETRFLWGSLR
ncbi:MAG: UvrD-helicase domain-containing protein, partial [Victivallaceae bacterium]